METSLIQVTEEDIKKLTKSVSKEIIKLRRRVILGVFNDKIPVLLRVPVGAEGLLSRIVNNNENTNEYKIHFTNLLGEWEISVGEQDEVLFKFYIPTELKKILANLTTELEVIDTKQNFLSTLVFSYFFGKTSIIVRLQINAAWIEEFKRNQHVNRP